MAVVGVRKILRGADLGLLTVTVVLLVIGLAALYSFTLNSLDPSPAILIRQGVFAVVGFGLAIGLMRFDYRGLAGMHWILYAVGIVALVAVRLFGQDVRGTVGWFEFGGFQLQPVEFVKLIMAVVLARFFSDHAHDRRPWRTIGLSALCVGLPVALVMWQPDLGSAVILLAMWIGLLFVLPLPRRSLLIVFGAIVLTGVAAWFFVLQPYQKDRLLNFVNPGRDPLGAGYNVRQAVTAVGSGRWFGRGLGLGPQSQLNFVPERHTDFIFATISEELGLFGASLILVLFGLFCWRLFRLAGAVRDDFSLLLCVALATMFFVQVAINIGMNIGWFPVTGIPLPFVSYGGSSLLASLMAVGLLESVVIRQRTAPL